MPKIESQQLKISKDQLWDFFQKYDSLTNLQKEIWSLSCWWVKRFPDAHPRQCKIAEKAGCRREHVNRTIALFKKWGWISLVSRRPRGAKTMMIHESLLLIDVSKREYFKRIEITAERTHNYSSYKKDTSRRTGTLDMPYYLQRLNISLDAKLKLSLVPESIYQSAIESAKKDHRKGKVFQNEERYVVGTAIRMAQKQGIKLEWRKYYACFQ